MNELYFNELYKKYHFGMVLFAKKYVGELLSQDFAHEAFIEIWISKNEHSHPGTFLFTCVKNKCINHLKSQSRRAKINEELKYLEDISNDYIEAQITKGEYVHRIIEEMGNVQEGRRKVIKLFYGGFSPKEISAILGIAESTVNVQVKNFIDRFGKNDPKVKAKIIDFEKICFWIKEINAKKIAARFAEAHKIEPIVFKGAAGLVVEVIVPPIKQTISYGTCRMGHPLNRENIYVDAKGRRVCKICSRQKQIQRIERP